jgi:ribosomal small subunit protein bTHX
MGRGDKRTKKGKIANHSFGKSRPKTKKKAVKRPVKAAPRKKTAK